MRTKRLILRQWKDEDRQLFFELNNDSKVMRYFPRNYTCEESDLFIDENIDRISNKGWGCWAVETIDTAEFIGFVGLSQPADYHPCAGNIDIGWRLSHNHWGKGYATEAAQRVLQAGFDSIGFDQIVSFTAKSNLPSISVMKKLGMTKDLDGFEHPRITIESPLRSHVVYRLTKNAWLSLD